MKKSLHPYSGFWGAAQKGCLLSASLPASFVPTMVMTELPASDKLFTASTSIAMEFDFIPINTLNIARTALPMMPKILVLIILFSRSFSNSSNFLKSSNRFKLTTFFISYNRNSLTDLSLLANNTIPKLSHPLGIFV